MFRYILFNKPYGVLSQFEQPHRNEVGPQQPPTKTLKDYHFPKNVYPVGRLDQDSEGLLFLTDDKRLITSFHQSPKKHSRLYWVQVEHIPTTASLTQLSQGLLLKDGMTLPAKAKILSSATVETMIPPRHPPIRQRLSIPTAWISIELYEGKNRQVRRMTAAIGHPTLRLIRWQWGEWSINQLHLSPGDWTDVTYSCKKNN